jgi:hypothetical protein
MRAGKRGNSPITEAVKENRDSNFLPSSWLVMTFVPSVPELII